MGKLDRLEDELEAIRYSTGAQIPIFGCYCAGEFGPTDMADAQAGVCYGRGWHVMCTAIGR